eukprot:jgi/Mesvir1/19510/Mv16607-RA.1
MPLDWESLVAAGDLEEIRSDISSGGMFLIADLVLNHRNAADRDPCTGEYTAFQRPTMNSSAVVSWDAKCGESDAYFCPPQSLRSGCSPCGNGDTGENFCAAPDLDHTSRDVQDAIKRYMRHMQSLGFSGWRFDFAKGYHGSFVGDYINASQPGFAVGEFFDGDVSKVWNWVQQTRLSSTAFDFPLRYQLQAAVRQGRFGALGEGGLGLLGVSSALATTFLDNHDTARADPFGDSDQIAQGYALLLTHPGTPCVFWRDWKDERMRALIVRLVGVRRQAGVSAVSTWRVQRADDGLYAATVQGTNSRVAMKIGRQAWSPEWMDPTFRLRASGNDFAVWMSAEMPASLL